MTTSKRPDRASPTGGFTLRERGADPISASRDSPPVGGAVDAYRTLMEGVSDGIFISDQDGRYLDVNGVACEMLGYTRDELLERTIAEIVAPEETQRLQVHIAQLSSTPSKSEWRFRRRDGTTFQGEVNVRRLADSRLLAVLRDISPLHTALRALRESESRFRALIEDIEIGVVLQDADDRVLIANPAARAIVSGPAPADLTGVTSRDPRWQLTREDGTVFPPDEVPSVLAARTLRPVRNVLVGALNLANGGRKWLQVTATPRLTDDGRLQHVLVTIIDVTEHRAAEQRVEESRRHLVASQHVAGVGSWEAEVMPDGQVNQRSLTWTDECYRVFGYAPGEAGIPEELFWKCLHPDDRVRIESAIAGSVSQGGVIELDHRILLADRSVRVIHERAELVRHPVTGVPMRFIGTAQDITDRLRLEDELRQSQKMQAIGQLAGGVAHDFNNTLTVISSYSEMLLRDLAEAPDEILDALVAIRDAGQRASLLTRQLLVFSRKSMIEPRVLDLNDVLHHAVKMLRRLIPESIVLSTTLAHDLSRIRMDPGQVEQVIINLALNGRDAMNRGGELTLATRNARIDVEALRSHPEVHPGQFVQLLVSDTGTGMSPEIKSHLFEPFFTTKAIGKGTGLGLATVYGIVRSSGGFISVNTAEGVGTTITVSLPAADEAPAEAEPARPTPDERGTETVLLVEDEEAVRRVVRRVLETEGYRVLEAPNGRAALALLDRESRPIDLLLSDIVMPEMNGRELAAQVRSRLPDCRVLLMSGYFAEAAGTGEHEATNSYALLPKPFSLVEVARKVREVLERRT